MFRWTVLLGSALILFGLQAEALPVDVALDWPAGMPTSPLTRVHIHAVRTVGPPDTRDAQLESDSDVAPNGAVLNLSEGVWQMQASAPGYWSQQSNITVARQSPTIVQLALWPAASLHGEILIPAGESLPHSVEVRLSATPASGNRITSSANPVPSHADLLCQVDKGTWNCLGPAGLFDIRVEASGYAPRYVWGISLKAAESADLGQTALRRTASVFGRAVGKNDSDPPGPCKAILQPAVERRGPGQPDRESTPAREPSISVPLSEHGYFQIVGMLPGKHLVTVRCSEASGVRELRVQSAGETRIDPPLQLQELTLDIAITPKLDPEGQPWRLTMDVTAPLYRRIANKTPTSADGRWAGRGLIAGNYRVSVTSSDGTVWLQRYFDLGERSRSLALRLASVKVAGRVMLGSVPVGARLFFFNDAGGQTVALKSDGEGRFEGMLPVSPETTWTVEAHVVQPPLTQRLLGVNVPADGGTRVWLDLDLPTIAVRGSVVSPDGQPQRSIQVTCEDSSAMRTTTSTDDAGNFELPDLPPGKYTAAADSPDGVSDRMPFEVVAGHASELKLVLNPFRRVHFNVVSNDRPVANAAVQVWVNPGVPRAFARTDQDGRFEVSVPPGTTELGLTVGAPGYAIKLIRLPIPSEGDESPDANNINLDDSGGKLVLNFQPPGGAPDTTATLYLVHNGAIQEARTISGWGANQLNTSGDGPATVDAIEPGKYALCSLADPAQVSALWSGSQPPDRCRIGSLEQGETLTLSPR